MNALPVALLEPPRAVELDNTLEAESFPKNRMNFFDLDGYSSMLPERLTAPLRIE